ncbi:helix-turn-helix domain-containing protein [Caballeronia sp. LZ001]|uniref:helix-turn-helix domain-containing protein n=1 Tax=Caballeronia sp. LZ001 TaxID=3038553 RepID=UPI0028571E37|nr:helix-turn-helix domain-containing protein [Caballeronia sp. LZ001]MDR5804752.1 helix-turn-helix domain-containing protein [Caballeronia sp. LZ001]
MEFHYSTDGIAARKRPEFWNDAVAAQFMPADGQFSAGEEFSGSLDGHTVGNVSVGRFSALHHCFERTEQRIRRDSIDDFVLLFCESGTTLSTQQGRTVTLQSGDIALNDSARPFLHDLDTDSLLLLRMPRTMVLSRFARAESMVNVRLDQSQPMVRLLSEMLRESFRIDENAPSSAKARFASAMVDTFTSVLEIQSQSDSTMLGGRHEQLYKLAMDYIEAHLDDYELSIDSLANMLHVSERTLSRIFAVRGTTVMQQIWRRRLDASYAVLKEGKVKQVTQAAYQCGFADLSHFCRLFKKVYGESPSTILRAR